MTSRAGPNGLGLAADDLDDAVWDYVFLGNPYAVTSRIPEEKLKILRREFL